MQPHDTASLRVDTSPPTRGFIVAAALSDGDVLGVHRDGGDALELRWVDAQMHDHIPITIAPDDLPIIAKLILDAADCLQNGGE